MAGAAKHRANKERQLHAAGNGSSSGETSSSGKASRSARSDALSAAGRSTGSRVSAGRPSRFDGNRDPDSPGMRNPATARPIVTPRNIDLPVAAYSVMRGQQGKIPLAPRPAASKLGQPIKVGLNTFNAEIPASAKIYQYDVSVLSKFNQCCALVADFLQVMIGNGVEKRGLIAKVWQSKAVQQELGKGGPGGFIFDKNKLAWSLKKIDREARIIVDLDHEEGRTPRADGKENKHRVAIRFTNELSITGLLAYMEGRTDFDNACLEAVSLHDIAC